MAKKKELKDEDIVALIDRQIKASSSLGGSTLAKERMDILDYYHGKRPRPMHQGNSKFVSQDVAECVDGSISMLLEAFSAGRQPVHFAPNGPDDIEQAKAKTYYCSHVFFNENKGHQILHDWIFDGLSARAGIVKVYWETDVEEADEELEGATLDEFAMTLNDPEVELEGDPEVLNVGLDGPLVSAKFVRRKDKSKCCVETIPPEDFGISERATSLDTAPLVYDRSYKTKEELLEMGVPESAMEEITFTRQVSNDDQEKSARSQGINDDNLYVSGNDDTAEVFNCYYRGDLDGSGRRKLWNVVKVTNYLIKKEQVTDHIYVPFVPLPIPHQFFGANFAAKVTSIQNVTSTVIRAIVDHTLVTTNPRWLVTKGALKTPRELMENRIGGIVNQDRPDGVQPLPQAQLNPFTFQVVQLMGEKKEDHTGISRLSQGLNKDAISTQNSQEMVSDLVTLSMQRTKKAARQFGEAVILLYQKIYNVSRDYQTEPKMINVAGSWEPVNPVDWTKDQYATLSLVLGYGAEEKEMQKRLSVHQMMASDPVMQRAYGEQQRYNTFKGVLQAIGVVDHQNYLADPSKLGPPPENPMDKLQLEMIQVQIAAQKSSIGVNEMKAEIAQMAQQLKNMQAQAQHAVKSDEVDLKERAQAHKEFVDKEEIELAKETAAIDRNVIVAPDS